MTTAAELDDMVANPVTTPQGDGTFFGEVVTLDRSDWKLVKGRGRVLFDPTYDDPADRVRALQITIQCERKDGTTFTIDTGQQPLLEIDLAWRKHLLPSIQKTNVALSTLVGKYVQVKRVPTGETYVNKSGETKQKTAIEIVAVFPDVAAMQAARQAHYGTRGTGAPAEATPAPAAQAPTIDRSALEKLLPSLWAAAGRNEAVFTTMFQANPALRDAFTLEEAITTASIPF